MTLLFFWIELCKNYIVMLDKSDNLAYHGISLGGQRNTYREGVWSSAAITHKIIPLPGHGEFACACETVGKGKQSASMAPREHLGRPRCYSLFLPS
jgi:hypothetical protein